MSTEVGFLQSEIAKVERNIRLIEEKRDTFVEKTAIPLDLIRDEEDQRERLIELRKRLDELLKPTAPDNDLSRLSAEAKIRKTYVDRDEERRLFREMISGRTPVHILLMEAEKGMGKTILLDQFWEISEGLRRARIDFKHSSYSMAEILRDMSDQYGTELFSMFRDVCCDVLRELGQDVKHVALLYSAMDLRLAKLPADDRQKYLQMIVDAFLSNLETIRDRDQPVVLLFDTFEKASDPTKVWLAEQLVGAIRRYPWLVCVITGRETPRFAIDNTNWCLQQKLQPLSDEHSREYIQKVIYIQDESVVTTMTILAEGHPLTLQQFVLRYVTNPPRTIGGAS